MRMHTTALVFVLTIGLCACAPKEVSAPTAPASNQPAASTTEAEAGMPTLSGTLWKIDEATGQKVASPEGARAVHIQFDVTTKHVTGFSGCNTFNGRYEAHEGILKLGPLISTKMACVGEGDKIEFAILQALGKATGYTIKDQTLTLTDADGAAVLRASVGKS